MKRGTLEKLLRVHALRLDTAFSNVREQQAAVRDCEQHLQALQATLKATRRQRKRYQRQLVQVLEESKHLPATHFWQHERHVLLFDDRSRALRVERQEAQQACHSAYQRLAKSLQVYHRAKAKRDRLEQRATSLRRREARHHARIEEREDQEFALAQRAPGEY